jgi:type I restriction enzyme S subunit
MEKKKNVPVLRFPEFSGEWEVKKLEDIVKINQGLQIPISERYTEQVDNSFFYITNEFLKEGSLKRYFIKAPTQSVLCDVNDILMTRTGNTGLVVTGVKGAFHNNFFKIKYSDKCYKWFLYYFLNLDYTQETIRRLAGTSTIPDLNHSDFYRIKITLPDFPEQQKIATIISCADDKLQALKKKKNLLEQYKKGMMQKIFSQELRFKDENRNKFPEWKKKKLIEVAKFRRGSFPQPYGLAKWYDDENGFPFTQVFDVDDNMKLKNDTKRKISLEAQNYSVFAKKGTVVLTIQGSIGRIAITHYDTFVDRTLLIFESYKVPIHTYFFMYSIFLLFQIEKEKAPGGTIKTITKEVLSEFKIFIPCLEEQTKIANFLSAIDDKINLCNTQIEKTEQWKKGLLQKMLV